MNSEKLKEAPFGRLSINYGLWTVVLQAIFSIVYIWFSFFFQEVLGASVARRESSNIDITDTQHLFSGILLLYYVVHCLLRLVEGPWDG